MMPRKKVPILREKRLSFYDEYENREILLVGDIVDEYPHFLNWLHDENTKSFRFIAPDERSISLRKEPRRSYGRDDVLLNVWYAYKTKDNRRRKKYIGVSENLTYSKLREVAAELLGWGGR